jgi:hypothetical protein
MRIFVLAANYEVHIVEKATYVTTLFYALLPSARYTWSPSCKINNHIVLGGDDTADLGLWIMEVIGIFPNNQVAEACKRPSLEMKDMVEAVYSYPFHND